MCRVMGQSPILSFLLYLPIVLITCILHLCLRILQHRGEKKSVQVLRHPCFTPKHGGQLQHLATLAINHPLDCQTQRDMGRIGNTLNCILFSSFDPSFSFFNPFFLSRSTFGDHFCFLLFYLFLNPDSFSGVITNSAFSNILMVFSSLVSVLFPTREHSALSFVAFSAWPKLSFLRVGLCCYCSLITIVREEPRP